MVCIYDQRLSNLPRVNGVAAPPARVGPAQRLRERVDLLECRIADLEDDKSRLAADNAVLRRLVQSMNDAADARHLRLETAADRARGQREWLDGLIAIVARHAGLDAAALRGAAKFRAQAWPRQMVAYLARQHLSGLSTPRIGEALGGRDHTTIVHAARVVGDRLAAGCADTVALYRACLPELVALAAGPDEGESGEARLQGESHGEG